MNAQQYSYRKFGSGSAVALAAIGGATLRGVWISTKGTSPSIRFDDAAASVTATAGNLIPATVPAALGWQDFGGVGCGTGLFFRSASCTGMIAYTPAGGG